ncbi:MAG: sugar kinase [Actinomycetaceae bacterium]|nr:sugar kinase [Actinomycetaceae bacterium]
MAQGFRTKLKNAQEPFVLAIDIGSTASRGCLYDARGLPIDDTKARFAHSFTTSSDGTSIIDADQIVTECRQILDFAARPKLAGRIAGVAIDTFSANLVGVDERGDAITPCYTYADGRCADQVQELRSTFDEGHIQQRTGTRFHSSYLAPRLTWLRQTDPTLFGRVHRWMALGEYIWLQLLGTTAIGTSAAAWTGLLDRHTGQWDGELLNHCGVQVEQLGEIRDPDQPLDDIHGKASAEWPGLVGARWFPVVPDGLVSNIGAGAPDSRTMAASAATSGAMRVIVNGIPEYIPSGLWAYRVSREKAILGGALNDVGRAVTWMEETLRLKKTTLDEVFTREPSGDTPHVLPYFTGERSTGWAARAQAAITGITFDAQGPELARGVMEGVCQSYARVFDQLAEVSGRPGEIRMSGRAMQAHPTWLAILADMLQLPVLPVTIKRATLHGTALLALDTLAPDVERADPTTGATFEPRAEHGAHYAAAREHFEDLYSKLVEQ